MHYFDVMLLTIDIRVAERLSIVCRTYLKNVESVYIVDLYESRHGLSSQILERDCLGPSIEIISSYEEIFVFSDHSRFKGTCIEAIGVYR